MIRNLEGKLRAAIESGSDERVILEQALAIVKYAVAREESAGIFCIRFGKTVLALLGPTADTQALGSDRQNTLRSICHAAAQRGFSVMLWSSLVQDNLDQPRFIAEELRKVISAKVGLNARIRKIAAGSTKLLGVTSDSRVFVDGYSVTTKDVVLGLTDVLGSSPAIYAPEAVNYRGYSEGRLLRDALLKHEVNVEVLGDAQAADFLREEGVAVLLTGAKAVSVFEKGRPEAISSQRMYDYPSIAKSCKKEKTKVVVVAGSYKFWPQDLYQEVRALRVGAVGPYSPRVDTIVPSEIIDFWVTQDGVFTNETLVEEYRAEFQPIPLRFPKWSREEEKGEAAQAVRGFLRGSGIDPERIGQAEFAEMVDVYRCQKYVKKHWDEFLSKFEGRYVAFVDERYIADAGTLEEMEERIKESTSRKHVYVERIVPRQSRQTIMSPGESR